MAARCVGGEFDGMPVWTREDAVTCEAGGGHVVEDGGGDCGSSSIAAMRSVSPQGAGSGNASQALLGLRQLRSVAREHPAVQAALSLNVLAAPVIARLARDDKALEAELGQALETVGGIARAVATGERGDEKFTKRTFTQLSELAERVAARSGDIAFQTGIGFFLALAEPMVGKTYAQIGREMGRSGTATPKAPRETVLLEAKFPAVATLNAANWTRLQLGAGTLIGVRDTSPISALIRELAAAKRAIAAKKAALGAWVGSQLGEVDFVTGGFRQQFEGADIYVGADGVAHEVHGEIRRKYDFLHGPAGLLGLPVTDETTTPDGIGRYNHFQHDGSIYWSPTSGPMMVRGPIRNAWAKQGWEAGPLGYPVTDEYRLPGLRPPQDAPNLAWSMFKSGAILSQGNAALPAVAAEISPDALRTLVRTFFDRRLHAANDDLGLEAAVDVVDISDWGYDFFASTPRRITYRLHGFHSNPIISDTTFEITIGLRFATAWPMGFTYPATMSLFVAMDGLTVHADGAGSGQVANGIFNGIRDAFMRGGPEPGHPEVPDGGIFIASFPTGVSQAGDGALDVINVALTAQGGLRVFVNPLPPSFGGIRRQVAQNQIDAFLEGF